MQPNLTTGGSVYVDQILGKARRLGVGPTGPIPAGGGLDTLTLADIIDKALNEDTPESQLLARQAGVLLSAMTTLAHEPNDKPGISEPIPASRPTDYNDMKDHYTNLCEAAKIDDTRKAETKGIATRINNNKDRYMEVQQKTNVPWFVIGALHYREANLNFLGHLHNGDNLLMLTVDVPADRPTQRPWPPAGESLRQIWTDSAVDAMKEILNFPALGACKEHAGSWRCTTDLGASGTISIRHICGITRTIIQRAAIVVIITSIQTMSRNRQDCSQQCLASRILEWILERLLF